jgi:hypothetical protein
LIALGGEVEVEELVGLSAGICNNRSNNRFNERFGVEDLL